MRRRAASLAGPFLILLLSCATAHAGALSLAPAGGAPFPQRAFTLTLSSRAALGVGQVAVRENGKQVRDLSLVSAAAAGRRHFGTVLLIDTSESMSTDHAIGHAIDAMRQFVHARNPLQPVGIIFFDAEPRVVVPMTTDTRALDAGLARVPRLHLNTHIFDAVHTALQMLKGAGITEGSIVLASDGRDTGSALSAAAAAAAARSQGVRVYTVGVVDRSFDGATLHSFASATSGSYALASPSALERLYRTLGIELSNEYVLHYRSSAAAGSTVQVTVTVDGYGNAFASYPVPASTTAASPRGPVTFWKSTKAAILVSVCAALLLALALFLLVRRTDGVQRRISGFVVGDRTAAQLSLEPQRTLARRALGERLQRTTEGSRWEALLLDLDVANIPLSIERVILLTLAATVVLGWLLVAATSSPIGGVLALTVPVVARLLIYALAQRRRRAFDEQLPDNLQIVASALRAGHTFGSALSVVVEDAPEPSRRELRRALADEQLGVQLPDALEVVSARMRSTDFQQVVLIARLQRDTGGNSAEVIDVVSDTIRERTDLRRLVRSLTAQGRLAAIILTGLPGLLLLAISLINPHYTRPLFHNLAGTFALVVGAVMVISGGLILRRIVDIEV